MTQVTRRQIFVHGVELGASIGTLVGEHGRIQSLLVDIDVDVVARSTVPDEDPVTDYRALAEVASAVASEGHIRLVETMAERIATRCATLSEAIARVTVTVRKPEALAPAMAGTIAVVER